MKEIGLGLLGFGTIGAGVVQGLRDNRDTLSVRLGAEPVIRRIADLDLETDRGVAVEASLLTRDAASVVNDPGVDIVVELIGGTTVARDLISAALELGKPVVTANKALLAEHGAEIFSLADKHGADLYYGASVGGGIPIIRALRDGLIANRIDAIYAILNGTCNYILTRMETDNLAFEKALAEAQEQGYAEADPSLDIDGRDTAHKAVILASLAYGFVVPLDTVYTEGIRSLSPIDIQYALDLGYRIKLLAVIKGSEASVEVRVHPTLVPLDHVLASVGGVYNGVVVEGSMAGRTLYYGKGAGREPTASTVIGDIADVVRNLVCESPRRVPPITYARCPAAIRPLNDVETRYYFRLCLADEPGVLARISTVLGDRRISIASALQKEGGRNGYVPVVLVTHAARERDVAAALREIDGMDIVGEATVALRIEA